MFVETNNLSQINLRGKVIGNAEEKIGKIGVIS